ncbi:TetR/AcrR family transcriptional regulator [Actinoalloteichus hymeniacidonis]|uniref:Transcriptional regulator, TetR family n=1 Tax=Actinoalloteichus hymeniacidonis TaxID=340345 RepID=A0AAC9MYY1_9PSEU|nr:TetR family transcriptional regulator [Actinoalloteichus hymeniacidonis]AOS63795.1 transcriptional regulator, TetR family [Actinoalloteichus hymeniacidonis]MBB5908151.1 AcrR family transcriptional regulator [Actinoalloteichus hymeniacidonis]
MKARIRDSAVDLFGGKGFAATSVRAIAEAAGASAALVIHHFGTKDTLREACDRYVLDAVFDQKDELITGDLGGVIGSWLADVDRYQPLLDYLARMLVEDSPASAALFDRIVTRTEAMLAAGVQAGIMRPSSDPRALATILATQGLVPLLLQHHLQRALGAAHAPGDVVRRMTIPLIELYTHGLYTDESILASTRQVPDGTDGCRPTE